MLSNPTLLNGNSTSLQTPTPYTLKEGLQISLIALFFSLSSKISTLSNPIFAVAFQSRIRELQF